MTNITVGAPPCTHFIHGPMAEFWSTQMGFIRSFDVQHAVRVMVISAPSWTMKKLGAMVFTQWLLWFLGFYNYSPETFVAAPQSGLQRVVILSIASSGTWTILSLLAKLYELFWCVPLQNQSTRTSECHKQRLWLKFGIAHWLTVEIVTKKRSTNIRPLKWKKHSIHTETRQGRRKMVWVQGQECVVLCFLSGV